MNTRKNIDIPSPCQKVQWNDMDIAASGRHCTVCDKTVVDFTTMDEHQILEVLSCGTKVCGNFTQHQLDQLNRADVFAMNSSSWWKKMVAAAVMMIVSLPFFRSEANVRPDVDLHVVITSDGEGPAIGDTIRYITITGNVTDTTNSSLTGCVISANSLTYKTQADMDGNFKLTIPDTTKSFFVSSLGYYSQKILIKPDAKKHFDIQLKSAPMIMGGVRIGPPIKKP